MLKFRKVTLSDRTEFENFLNMTEKRSMEYSFSTMFLWQDLYSMEFCIHDDTLFLRIGEKEKFYLFPIGSNTDKALDIIAAEGSGFYGLTRDQADRITATFPGRYEISLNRDMGDYVYKSEALATLSGKKLSSKRNHINRFTALYPDWEYEPITRENLDEVRQMHQLWCSLAKDKEGLAEEEIMVKKAFDNFFLLDFSGGLIRVGGKVVAFTAGDKLSDSTFLVHIEKALAEYSGAYQIINREFVRNSCMDYEFINREEDTGDEGLRKAKLSYKPYMIIEKFTAKAVI